MHKRVLKFLDKFKLHPIKQERQFDSVTGTFIKSWYMAIFKIDVDGVLRDIMTPMCELYNEKFDENIKPEMII